MIKALLQHVKNHPIMVDAVVAAALFACSFPGSIITWPGAEPRATWWSGVVLAGISCTALLLRRSRPRITVALTMACAMALATLGYILSVLLLGPLMVALYTLAGRTDRKTANTFTFAGIALLVGTALIAGPADEPLVLKMVGPAAWMLVPTALGTAHRLRGAYLEAVQARAEYAERTREEEASHRVTEERMRIARELHDVVAHHLALANAQAGTAAHLARTSPEQTQRILTALAGTTSSALRELKATVGLLRQENDPDTSLEPSPGLARLPELTAACESAGLKVTVTTEGRPRPLSPGVDLTAFRIVQEALTNVTKHAAAAAAHIRLVYARDQLTITVTDDGTTTAPTTRPAGRGFGLIGMRERAHSVGGDLKTGHRAEGGFEVTTALPLHHHDTEPEVDRTT